MGISEKLEALFAEKGVPITKDVLQDNLVLYRVDFKLKPTHILRMEMIVPELEGLKDVQITYRYISFLKDYNKKGDTLALINDLNEVRTGYYRLYLAHDGEIYLKTLVRSSEDVLPIYEVMVQAPTIVANFLPEIEEIAGEFNNMSEFV